MITFYLNIDLLKEKPATFDTVNVVWATFFVVVTQHLMFGVITLFADQFLRLLG
jgi:hypothetical protein